MFRASAARSRVAAARAGGLLFGTVRLRLTLLAVIVVGLGLFAGAATVVTLVQNNLASNAEHLASVRARDTATAIVASRTPYAPLASDHRARTVVQIVAPPDRVVASSPELRGRPPLVSDWPTGRITRSLRNPGIAGDADYVVVGLPVTVAGQQMAVYAFTSLDSVGEGVEATISAQAVAIPLLLAAIAVASWLLVGRALRPVEAMRRQVAEITATQLDRRVPEPAVQDELGLLARTMNAMLARLEQAHDRQHRFVSDAAHELRSPVAAILTRVEVGLGHREATDWPRLAGDVHREATRLGRLVDELLILSRMDGSGPPGRAEQVDLDELVLQEVEAVRARGQVSVDLTPFSPARLRGRQEELRRIVRNLLDNAERHARSRISVALSTTSAPQSTTEDAMSATGDVVELVVSDDGAGIPEADRERVFDRFHRLQAARDRDSGGTGLGLSIIRDIASAYGGRAWIADAEGGAEVHVRLPLSAPSRPADPGEP